jgi:hypothetical protein
MVMIPAAHSWGSQPIPFTPEFDRFRFSMLREKGDEVTAAKH